MADHIDLGGFLRARREAVSPADVGLRGGAGRRRTPGLRREEVAALAGVSVDYVVRLEQGRDRKPSAGVLAALADALLLSDEERAHLATLASIAASPEMCPRSMPAAARSVPETIVRMLEALDPAPAFVLAPWAEVLAANDGWRTLVGPLGLLDQDPPNLAVFTFLDPRARQVFADWGAVADRQVGELRAADVRWGRDPLVAPVLEHLRADREFARRWARHGVGERRRAETRLTHPDRGDLRVVDEVLVLPDGADQRLVTWLPGDDRTAEALAGAGASADRAPAGSARLRVVS